MADAGVVSVGPVLCDPFALGAGVLIQGVLRVFCPGELHPGVIPTPRPGCRGKFWGFFVLPEPKAQRGLRIRSRGGP